MNRLMLLAIVVDRNDGERCVSVLSAQGVGVVLVSAAYGTANSEMLSILGLDETEKQMIFAIIRSGMAQTIMQKLLNRLKMVAFTMPMSSISGALTFKEWAMKDCAYVEENELRERESVMKTQHSVVVVIANRGYMDDVMEGARKAGATGGTLIHAKGASTQAKEKFFGISFAEDKEMIFIVADEQTRTNIMKTVVHNAGMHTKAKAMVFSLPVSEIAGFTGLSSDDMAD